MKEALINVPITPRTVDDHIKTHSFNRWLEGLKQWEYQMGNYNRIFGKGVKNDTSAK